MPCTRSEDSRFGLAPKNRVLRLTRNEGRECLGTGHRCRGVYLLRFPLAEADGAHFAGADCLVQSLECLFKRGFGVVTMALIKIYKVGVQAPQRMVQLLFNLRS